MVQMNFIAVDWGQIGANLLSVGIAYVLAMPIGWEREKNARTAGLRTFPLVAVASCGYMLLANSILGGDPAGTSRVIQGLMTGIGFIGGGAILKHGMSVKGTATAASVWNTGAIGAAVAFHRYEIAIILMVINFLTLRVLTEFKNADD